MPIYLKHPRHGTKVAISDMEAAADEQNGWERYSVASPSPIAVVEAPVEAPSEISAPRVKRQYTRKAK